MRLGEPWRKGLGQLLCFVQVLNDQRVQILETNRENTAAKTAESVSKRVHRIQILKYAKHTRATNTSTKHFNQTLQSRHCNTEHRLRQGTTTEQE